MNNSTSKYFIAALLFLSVYVHAQTPDHGIIPAPEQVIFNKGMLNIDVQTPIMYNMPGKQIYLRT